MYKITTELELANMYSRDFPELKEDWYTVISKVLNVKNSSLNIVMKKVKGVARLLMQLSGKSHHMIVTISASDDEKRENILQRIENDTYNLINKLNTEIKNNEGFIKFQKENDRQINVISNTKPTSENIQGII